MSSDDEIPAALIQRLIDQANQVDDDMINPSILSKSKPVNKMIIEDIPTCPVCFEAMDDLIGTLACGHSFCHGCIQSHFN